MKNRNDLGGTMPRSTGATWDVDRGRTPETVDEVPGKLGEEIRTPDELGRGRMAQVADTFVGDAGGNEMMDRLEEMLRGEMSAVETYNLALERAKDPDMLRALRQLRDDHDHRVTILRDRLRMHGVEPTATS